MTLTNFFDLIKQGESIGDRIAVANIDDIFWLLNKYEIKEVEVSKEEMRMIVSFYLANANGDKNGNQGKIISEGKIDKFLGINLILK